ncbi:hypothetical protein [Pedobacter psychroterrae]|uniref:Uncharacterized protein n=1 Tax=Pedobacter psychroterrae TaxID=2530453 RepID=A0A4R0NE22_9SPHI|nr:hypothetical protein [Pedobacter psychroterrae]TCC96784.1 hypothetical protein EZ437_20550 [Pedobacter psychroterrae]
MKISYFKPRKPFSFASHQYELGTFMGLWHSHDDNHFLLKIYKIDEKEFVDYYNHHLNHALENKLAIEEDFFRHVWQIVQNRIRHFEMQNPFSSNHAFHRQSTEKLLQFQKHLQSIDKWNARPPQLVIAEKEELIIQQRQEIDELKEKINQFNQFEVAQKIRIEEEHLATLVDLIKQIRELKLPSGRLLLRCDNKSPYSKMISKYFSIGGKDIPTETTRNYFVEKKGDVATKGTAVKSDQQLFKIIPLENKK